jgi:hypothetical protein
MPGGAPASALNPAIGGSFGPSSPGWNPAYNGMTPTSTFGNPATFTAAANTQGGDYNTIMNNYANIASDAGSGKYSIAPQVVAAPTPVNPTQANYTTPDNVTGSISNLSDIATTGGFTPQGIADIRARDTSPTRSIYANAQQNVDRSRGLGGGYSPGANATQASLARDESNQISNVDTAAEAGIAQNVTANKLAGSQALAGAVSAEAGRGQAAGQFNSGVVNQINEANQQAKIGVDTTNVANKIGVDTANANRGLQGGLAAAGGQSSLYGTTPALTNTFGNQVVQAAQLGQNQQQLNQQNMRNIFGAASGGW